MSETLTNTLFYGDNLPILRQYLDSESVDLIYLDPPFNSNRSYNVLFKDESGVEAPSQITAFEDTWHWNSVTERLYQDLVTLENPHTSHMISAMRGFIGANQMMTYLVMMTARLVELRRILKPTGSLYLHCDPTASHYLKIVLDTVFGSKNFLNEIVWCYKERGISKTYYNKKHDVILFYCKERGRHVFNWNSILEGYSPVTIKKFIHKDEQGRHFRIRGRNVPEAGKWRRKTDIPIESESEYTYRQYMSDQSGSLPRDWIEMPFLNQASSERLGYPTQKPEALLERFIQASSNPGDIVLDPFCGCGTTIAAAQKFNRRWIGIDITHLAIALQKYRLKDSFGLEEKKDYRVIGEPEDVPSARQLAQEDRYQFQWWALSLIKARPTGGAATTTESGVRHGKKGADKGIDGIITFIDEADGKAKRLIVQVKSGKVKSGDIRDLRGVIEREQAAMGVFITLEAPSRDMETEAAVSGHYHSPGWNTDYPRLQILTIADLITGAKVNMPQTAITFKQAGKVKNGLSALQGNLV